MSQQRVVSEQKLRRRINYLIAAMIVVPFGFAICAFVKIYIPLIRGVG